MNNAARYVKNINKLGELLKTHREALGLTQSSLAKKLGVNKSYVAQLENGRRKPSLKLVRCIADTLGLEGQEILVLAHPETRELLTPADSEAGRKMSQSWERFMKAGELLKTYHVTNRELQVLEHLSFLGTPLSAKDFLAILILIRDIPKNSRKPIHRGRLRSNFQTWHSDGRWNLF